MKRIFIAVFIASQSIGYAQNKELHLASDVWPPFTNMTGEKAVALNIVQTCLTRIDHPSSVSIHDFTIVMDGIKSGKYDGSAALWKTPAREEMLVFSEPYLQNQLVLVGLTGKNVNVKSIDELKNQRIGLVSNYAYDESLLSSKNTTLVFSESDQINLEKLFENQIDYMLVDALLIEYMLQFQMNDVKEHLAISTEPFQLKGLHFALSKEVPDAEKIIAAFNEEIKVMQKDGTYNEILQLNWIAVDVDNDGKTELVLTGDGVGSEEPTHGYSLFYQGEQASAQTNYYINDTVYSDWESVPTQYKENVNSNTPAPSESGLIIRF